MPKFILNTSMSVIVMKPTSCF